MKDNFSTNSEEYSKFRPRYPEALFRFLETKILNKENAWDCGTGNGQVAAELSEFFTRVEATDISAQQLESAIQKPNIFYSKQPAEKTKFPENSFDLITVAQAIHWFDFEKFYIEVRRVFKPKGFIAVMGYSLFNSSSKTDEVIYYLYEKLLGKYWDKERRYLEEAYQSIPFPFNEIETPNFSQEYQWNFEQLIGYLKTWSAVKHFEKAENYNPVDKISPQLKEAFGEIGKVFFPILFRFGQID